MTVSAIYIILIIVNSTEYTNNLKRLSKLGKKNPMWKGNNVGYFALHEWVRSRKQKPLLCEMCNKKPPLDLANITGIYNRDSKNWKYICRRCHMVSDGRIKNLRVGNNGGSEHPMFGRKHSIKSIKRMKRVWILKKQSLNKNI